MRYSPLRYPGGKGQLAEYVLSLMTENNIINGKYVEPYAGGAGIALFLLLNRHVKTIYINDIDTNIYSFWYAILNNTKEFISKINSTPITVDEWDNQKQIFKNSVSGGYSTLDIGFATFFLNRTNRSGILKGGMIGGRAQDGNYRMDCRFNKSALIKTIDKIASYKNNIKLSNMDAIYFLRKYKKSFSKNTLVYLDPPYYNKGHQLYINSYTQNDHERLSKYLTKYLHCPWIVSYDDVTAIRSMYDKLMTKNLSINYSVETKRKGNEIIIFGQEILKPI